MDNIPSHVDLDLWQRASHNITWIERPRAVIDASGQPPNPYVWFPGGKLNTCYNCVDRHDGNAVAVIYDSAVTNTKKSFTFAQLREHVVRMAGVLRNYGVQKGDTVLIYMPMVPEAVFCMLACARLGAVHSVVFGGFAPKELAKRIDDAKPKVLVTASCGIEPKRVIPYKPLVNAACSIAAHHIPIKLVYQRPGQVQAELNYASGDRDLAQELAKGYRFEECVPVASEDPLYTLYTSGTTGVPKGVLRTNGGHAVALRWSMDYIFNVKKGEVMFTASDIGWAVSHSYTVYGPLLAGVTTILYEGKPVNTPDASAFWRIIDEYNVKTMFTAPTAIRAIRREDPDAQLAKRYDLSRLQALFLAGERSDPETLRWCQQVVSKSLVIDHYWSTELGSPVTATCVGADKIDPIKWGSAGRPVPGSSVCILTEDNKEATEPNQFGQIVLRLPLSPTAFPSLWKNVEGYKKSYFEKYPGYFDTGDAGIIDEEGYVHIMARTDDIINVAGHRLSTGSIEQILIAHPQVAECCVVPMADKLKGHVPLGVMVLKQVENIDQKKLLAELISAVRSDLGAIACFERAVFVPRLAKTRSGKTLRRCIRDMVDGKEVKVPATIEDETVLSEIQSVLQKEGLIPAALTAKL